MKTDFGWFPEEWCPGVPGVNNMFKFVPLGLSLLTISFDI
jgi:hypothetical protein